MSFELVLFILVAAVAIFSAALMLISRNAVHAALFLVINLLCVSFFYLMLNAPFLAMVQITVYAGAIMVLFMFVIMLLGSEKLSSASTRYPWIATGAVILTTIFMIVAFIAIVQGQIGGLRSVPPAPEARIAHMVANAPAVDVYLNDRAIATDLAFEETTSMAEVPAGSYNMLVFAACTLENRAECPNPLTSGAAPLFAQSVTLEPETTTTHVLAGTPDALRLVSVPTDLTPLEDENTFRLTVVNALPESGSVQLFALDEGATANNAPVAPAQGFGEAASTLVLPRGTYNLAWQAGDARLAAIRDFTPRNKTHEVLVLAAEPVPQLDGSFATRPAVIRLDPERVEEAYGSPQQIGVELLTTYLLPFELVALLLLGAMVGAIILTREEILRRERKRLVVSPAIRRINRGTGIPGAAGNLPSPADIDAAAAEERAKTGGDPATAAAPTTSKSPAAEPSAD